MYIFMTVHFLKPALRANDVYEFGHRQSQWYMDHKGETVFPVWTSRRPARVDELLDGGSVYWIVKNQIQCRQKILDFATIDEGQDEKPSYLILCDTQLVRTQAIARRAFQGWRYLDPSNVPDDIGDLILSETRPPPEMEKELREAGLL